MHSLPVGHRWNNELWLRSGLRTGVYNPRVRSGFRPPYGRVTEHRDFPILRRSRRVVVAHEIKAPAQPRNRPSVLATKSILSSRSRGGQVKNLCAIITAELHEPVFSKVTANITASASPKLTPRMPPEAAHV